MPRLMTDDTMKTGNIGGIQGFKFSGIRTEHLGASGYTLATIAVDATGSTLGFEKDLRKCLIAAVEGCKKSPYKHNLLVRVIKFSTAFPGGIEELHGFKPVLEIETDDYPEIEPAGQTPLYDAVFSSIGAAISYAEELTADDYNGTNGIVYIITDGSEYPLPPDNPSVATPAMIKKIVGEAIRKEKIESLISILIGINASEYSQELEEFKEAAGIDEYIDAGDVTKGKLAKISQFISQSTSSQAQAQGTGGPSQNISATI